MTTLSVAPLIFAAGAIIFLALALCDFLAHGSPATGARKAWLRIGLIFALVAIFLLLQGSG
jgi:hypothetical protein